MLQTPSTSLTATATPREASKKRKADISTPDGPSKKSRKEKRKHLNVLEGPSTPGETSSPASARTKSKRRASPTEEGDMSEFAVVSASVLLSIPPVFSADPSAGVEEMLDSMVMRHIPSLHGIVLSHSNHRFLSSSAPIQNDCPYSLCRVAFDATVWSPKIGMSLVGKVNLFSPDHISLLIHRTFNISIPRSHIPDDQYVFKHGSTSEHNIHERHTTKPTTSSSSHLNHDGGMDLDDGEPEVKREAVTSWVVEENTAGMIESVGCWVQRATGEKVGGTTGTVQFTVVGMTLANQMISLIGSLQPQPFDPRHSDVSSKLVHHRVPDTLANGDDEESLPDLGQLAVSEGVDSPKKRKNKAGGDSEKRKEKEAQKEARRLQDDGIEARPKKKKKTKKETS